MAQSAETSSYAILGATGNTGSSLIQVLLNVPNTKVHAYCRSKAKLTRMLPEVVENKKVEIFEGSIEDVDLLANCVRGCQAVFLTISTNDNVPGCRMSQNSTRTVIRALDMIRTESGPDTRLPKLVLLSSATLDEHLARTMPKWFKPIMKTAASHVYKDLEIAEELLRSNQDWVTSIFIKPAGLSLDKQRGHRLTLDDQESFLSYLDLAAGMIEAVDDPDGRYDMKNVGVVSTGGSAKFPPGTPLCIVVGLLRHFFPWMHSYLPSTGPA
jgi:putative NADH-flavin reductase